MNPLQEYGIGKAGEQLKTGFEGTKAGQDYAKWADEGGLNLGEKLGKKLGKIPYFTKLAQMFEQLPEEDRWDYDHIDPETGEPGVSY